MLSSQATYPVSPTGWGSSYLSSYGKVLKLPKRCAMNLIGEMLKLAETTLGSPAQGASLLPAAIQLLQQTGGIQGLTQKFEQQGLGGLLQSWVSTGQNLPISAAQIEQVLGPEAEVLAAKVGMTPDEAHAALAKLLPTVIDRITPNGQLSPEMGMIEKMFGLGS